jgi:glycosyltransferase involved in cell wall biosynthesis
MRLLVLAPSSPFPARDGVHLRLQNLLGRLPEGWSVRLVCFDGVPQESLETVESPLRCQLQRVPSPAPAAGWRRSQLVQIARPLPALIWKFRSRQMEEAVRKSARQADAVLAVGLQMAPYLTAVPREVPVALDNYNVESRVLARLADTRSGPKRAFWRWEATKLERVERRLLASSGTVFAISDVDRAGMLRLAPRCAVETVPMGIDLSYFQEQLAPPQTGATRFTFVGAFNWHVNEAAAEWLCQQVWPQIRRALPDAELHLVGRDPSPTVKALGQAGSSIHVSGTVPDVRPFLRDSTALLVPLRYGSGVRTKILEAFAVRRPVISTSVGCEGLPVQDGVHLLVADDAERFAASCIRLAEDREAAERLADTAFDLVREHDRLATERFRQVLSQAFPVAKGRDAGDHPWSMS